MANPDGTVTQPAGITPRGTSTAGPANTPKNAKPMGGDNVNDRFSGVPDKVAATDDNYVLDVNGFKGVDPIYQNGASALELPVGAPDPDAA